MLIVIIMIMIIVINQNVHCDYSVVFETVKIYCYIMLRSAFFIVWSVLLEFNFVVTSKNAND